MKKQLLIVGALAMSLASVNTVAQEKTVELEEVVISATKFKLKKEQTGKVIYKITQKDIENNAGKSVVELLNNLPGVEIKGTNSNANEIKGIYVRGGRSRQVLVLIDGVPVSDPTGINQEFDLRLLSLNQIESIEVLKGASSSLYGSGAATGVINIILKKSSKKEISGSYEVSLGTNNDSKTKGFNSLDGNHNLSVNGTLNKINYLAYFNLSGVDGMSAAKSKTNASFEKDAFSSENGFFKLGYQVNDNIKVESFFNYDAFDYSYDAGAYKDSDINKGNNKQIRYGIKPSFKYSKGEAYVLASFNEIKRNLSSWNSFSNVINNYIYTGESVNVDAVNKLSFSEGKFQLITGLNYQTHNNNTVSDFGNIEKKSANFNTLDPYASLVYLSDYGFNLNLGGRYNVHSKYGNHFVYDINSSYSVFEGNEASVKVLASYGTSYVAPSTYQLFSQYGNLDLTPESNATIEAGFELGYKEILQFNAVYFNRTEEDAIIFVSLPVAPWTSQYENATNKIKVNGLETDITIKPIDKVNLNLGYTLTNKDSKSDYIPKHKVIANLEVNPFRNAFVSLLYKNIGERTYFDKWGGFGAPGTDVVLPSYSLLDLNANYKVLDGTVTFFGSLSNIFNEDYEETLGYSTRGRNFKLGLRLKF